jgi:hypothetical protein
MPVSMLMVRLVISVNFNNFFGTKYPMVNPTQCKVRTDPTINGNRPLLDKNKLEFCATTPPQIKETNNTEAKGVNRDTLFAKLGKLALTIIPIKTGAKMTRAVASHKVMPDTEMAFPTNNLTNRGVTRAAKIVEQDVNNTLKATSAWAIKDTRLLAVPPGEHPTKAIPKKRDGPKASEEGNKKVRPIIQAVKGMIQN